MAGTTAPVTVSAAVSGGLICRTGFIRRAEPIGFIQRGTHRLVDLSGRVIAALRSNRVNLFALEGQFLTVCGIDEGVIEGVRSILVTQVFPAGARTGQLDLRTLLLFQLFANPGVLRFLNPALLFLLLGSPFGFGKGTSLGLTGLGAAAPGTTFGLGGGIGTQLALQAGLGTQLGQQGAL